MKTLRFLWMVVGLACALAVSADGPTYKNTYRPQMQQTYKSGYTATPVPFLNMTSTGSSHMSSGSSLPLAAVDGAYTTYDNPSSPARVISRPRRVGEDEGFEDEEDPENPGEPFPLGDGLWPLGLLALAYVAARTMRKRKAYRKA